MEITPRELRDTEIAEAFRGYNRDVVNDMLERAAAALEAANERLRQMGEQVSSAQAEAGRTRETEDILHRTLLLAQRAADEAVAEAQQKSRQMLEEAEITSRKVLTEAEADARRRGEAERLRLEEEVVDLAARRDALAADVEAMSRFEADYREGMVRALEADLTALRTRPTAAPGPRPEPSDVEIPSPEAMARRDSANPPADPTSPVDVRALIDQQIPSTLQSLSQTGTADAAAKPPATPPSRETPPEAGEARDAATTATGQPAPHTTSPSAPEKDELPVRERPAIDLESGEVEAEVLDDDAFFATLREAVHDDAPLGPRDDDRLSFFDHEDDADRGSFRDVFRRRR